MTAPALQINDLKFRYAEGGGSSTNGAAASAWTIDLPSLALARGEQALLAGPSGSGKSTLLYLIAGLIDPANGVVMVDGQPVHALPGHQRDILRGRSIGMIFQTFNLLPGFTAAQNVMAALMFSPIPAKEHRDRTVALLRSLGLDDRQIAADPDRLSVGQQQRVAVARAVACSPALVLADEPTASLDPENAAAAMNLIQQTCKAAGAALLCTSHDPAMKPRFERTLHLIPSH